MTRKPYIESSISALQNRGGYCCRAVLDNPSYRTYRALSWLFAAASAFVCIINLCASARSLCISCDTPSICPLSPLEPHWNLIGS